MLSGYNLRPTLNEMDFLKNLRKAPYFSTNEERGQKFKCQVPFPGKRFIKTAHLFKLYQFLLKST